MVRLGLSAALTPYPPPPSTTTAIAPQMMRRRFLPFLPFFQFPKALPLLDIPDPRCLSLDAASESADLCEVVPSSCLDGRSSGVSFSAGRDSLKGADVGV